jgi:hypothetical protein
VTAWLSDSESQIAPTTIAMERRKTKMKLEKNEYKFKAS